MRILYSHRIQSRDGQGVHLDELVAAFRQAGHEVLVVGPRQYEEVQFGGESLLIRLVRRCLPAVVAETAELLYNISAFLRLRRAYRQFKPDLVYERYNLYFLGGMLLRRWFSIPFFLEVNSPLALERTLYGGLAMRRLARRLERSIWQAADRVLVVSDVLKEIVAASGVSIDRIAVVRNGVDRAGLPAFNISFRASSLITLGFVGFIRDWHGLEQVIAGLAKRKGGPSLRLVIVGDGPAGPALKRQALALGVADSVEFMGLLSREAIPDAIARFDIALQPRVVDYASPLKIFEYMAMGCAIIAPNQPNIREILSDGDTALLFFPDEPSGLWWAIDSLIEDPGMRVRLGRSARRALETHDYTWQRNVQRIIEMAERDGAHLFLSKTLQLRHSTVAPNHADEQI